MKSANTVRGTVPTDRLGITLIHEHILFAGLGWYADTLSHFDRRAAIDRAVGHIERLVPFGVKTIVDATSAECGRDPEFLREVSERTDINIICATGWFNQAQGGSPYWFYRRSFGYDVESEIQELLLKEVTEGIGGTGIKPGVIKLASGFGRISGFEKMFFKAAAWVQRQTGVPIITHTERGTAGPEQAEFLRNQGADPKGIMIGHMSDNLDMTYQASTLGKGVYIGFDRMGFQDIWGFPTDAQRYSTIAQLVRAGYAERIMLSHDFSFAWQGRPCDKISSIPQFANWRPTHVFENVLPALRKAGVTDAQANTMLVENPRRLFSFAESKVAVNISLDKPLTG